MASWSPDNPDRYPASPLASRRADPLPKVTHLFTANGQPRQTTAQKVLLRETAVMLKHLADAHAELTDAVQNDDAKTCAAAVRRLTSIGMFLREFANLADEYA